MTLPTLTAAHSDGWKIDHTPGSALAAGAVVNAGQGVIGYADQAIAASRLGSLAIKGCRRAKKAASVVTFAVGDEVIWDVTNGLAVQRALSLAGDAHIPLGICVVAAAATDDCVIYEPFGMLNNRALINPFVYEFDFETTAGTGTGVKTLLPGWMNRAGLIFYDAFGIVTEVFGGASEDQGIVTLKDTAGSPATLGTITAANAGDDAVGDIIRATADAQTASDGDAAKFITAGLGITGTITQLTAGSGEAGKMKVYLHLLPLL